MKEKINFITEEVLSSVVPDVSALETVNARSYIGENYRGKGEVLCVPSPYHDMFDENLRSNNLINVAYFKGDNMHAPLASHFNTVVHDLGSDTQSIPMLRLDRDTRLVQNKLRIDVEHNPHHWQLVVCGVILTNEGIVLLKNKNSHPRLPNMVTTIQGHIEPSINMHLSTSRDFIINEFLREVNEEVEFVGLVDHDYNRAHISLLGALQVNIDPVAMEHLGMVLVMDLRGFKHPLIINSNEPDKHQVINIKSRSDLKNHQLDSWVYYIVDMVYETCDVK